MGALSMQQVAALQGMGALGATHPYPHGMAKDSSGKTIKPNDARYYCGKTVRCPAKTLSASEQKEYAEDWRVGGDKQRLMGAGDQGAVSSTPATKTATPTTRTSPAQKSAAPTLKKAAAPTTTQIDKSYTSVTMSKLIGPRSARVSPLAQSWQFALQPTPGGIAVQTGGSGMKWAMIGLGVLLAGGAVYLLVKD